MNDLVTATSDLSPGDLKILIGLVVAAIVAGLLHVIFGDKDGD